MLRIVIAGVAIGVAAELCAADPVAAPRLKLTREGNILVISGSGIAGPVRINYLEAYCRPGSTNRDWAQTKIFHRAETVSMTEDGAIMKLRDRLEDGVIVDHTITAGNDEVDFRVVAHNPTGRESLAQWAQPCMRVDRSPAAAAKMRAISCPPTCASAFCSSTAA